MNERLFDSRMCHEEELKYTNTLDNPELSKHIQAYFRPNR